MGSKINLHVEVQKNDKWYHMHNPDMLRDGVLFDMVAGLNDQRFARQVAPVKGLPSDITDVTAMCYEFDKSYAKPHHETWLNVDELRAMQEQLKELYQNVYDRAMAAGHRAPSRDEYDLDIGYLHLLIGGNSILTHDGWDDARLVVWFQM